MPMQSMAAEARVHLKIRLFDILFPKSCSAHRLAAESNLLNCSRCATAPVFSEPIRAQQLPRILLVTINITNISRTYCKRWLPPALPATLTSMPAALRNRRRRLSHRRQDRRSASGIPAERTVAEDTRSPRSVAVLLALGWGEGPGCRIEP